jgi:hypothetical protein
VVKAKVGKPAVTNVGLVYTGGGLSAGIAGNSAYTVTGDRRTNAGDYVATVALRDPASYEWADGTTGDLSLAWSIGKAAAEFVPIEAVSVAYSPSLRLSDVVLPSGYAWVNLTMLLGPGSGQSFAVTFTDPSGNYEAVVGSVTVNVQFFAGVAFINPVSRSRLGAGEVSDTAYSGEVYTVRVRLLDQDYGTLRSAVRVRMIVMISGVTVPKTITTDAGTGIGEYEVSITGEVADGRVTLMATVMEDSRVYSDTADLLLEKRVSVSSSGREIPAIGPGVETAAVIPVKALSGGLTAGPNPAGSLRNTPVRFFRTGGRVEKASLCVYDAVGNTVKAIKIEDSFPLTQEKRTVGSWDLTDKRGRPVPGGAYAVKGTITTAGGMKERVSLIINVR